ncbi:MAG: DUF4070 domain-containing protein [Desulfobacteraceae bacterium]|nr:DUF4070 domain-containing protein [Desulfobacteraceae bacterium]
MNVVLIYPEFPDTFWGYKHTLKFIRLGVVGGERFQYWKLIIWTLVRCPELFPMAIRFAIYGHHFRKINELYIM